MGVLILEFDRAPVSERGVEPALVVDLVDEAWKRMDDVGECLVAAEIHLFGLERLHEALGLSVVIGPLAEEACAPSTRALLAKQIIERARQGERSIKRLVEDGVGYLQELK